MNAEAEIGAIAPGYLADFAVLDRIISVPEDQIKSISCPDCHEQRSFGAQDYRLSPELPAILPAWSPVKYFGSYYGEK